MAEAPPLPAQPLPEWMSYSLITYPDGSQGYTIVDLPLTYYGPSIPLGTDYTYGGSESPAATGEPTPTPTGDAPQTTPEPVTITFVPEPVTVTVTVTVTETIQPAPTPTPIVSPTFPSSSPTTSIFAPVPTGASTVSSFSSLNNPPTPTPQSTVSSSSPTPIIPFPPGSSSSGSSPPASITSTPSTSPATSSSSTQAVPESAVPIVAGTSRSYLGLAPGAFLGVVLAIVFSLLLLLFCLFCWCRHRRRQKRRQPITLVATPPNEYSSRLLAGDRDPTREDLTYQFGNHNREYRRSQIAMMRARGELDDEWEDRMHSPSMRSASIRLPEDDVGTAYGIRERALAAAGVGLPYAYSRVPRDSPRDSPSMKTGMRSIAESSNVATVTPGTMGGAGLLVTNPDEQRASPTPRKDTQSTDATNDSSALHMYAAGGRSRTDSSAADNFFYQRTSEGEGPSPVASSSDLHFLSRFASPAAAAGAAALITGRRTGSSGKGSGSSGGHPGSASHTRNLEDIPSAAIAYPESPVSDTRENDHLMQAGGETDQSVGTYYDLSSGRHSRSTRESALSRWAQDRADRSMRGQQQPPIFQRILNKVLGTSSSQPSFTIVPPSDPSEHQVQPSLQQQQTQDRVHARISSRDFDFGGGLLFPRPPIHTGYSSASASTARDDMRKWGGVLPSRWSSGTGNRTPANGAEGASMRNVPSSSNIGEPAAAASRMEQGNARAGPSLGVPIRSHQDLQTQMSELTPTATTIPLMGFGLRPPPPSAFPIERTVSGISSGTGRSTVYYDAHSRMSTPMGTMTTSRDRAASPHSRLESPPPQPIGALRSAQSDASLQSTGSGPETFLPPGLFITPSEQEEDILDEAPPMPIRDVRQARSLNTILSVSSAETYDTANPPASIGRAFRQDESIRFPPPNLDPAPRTLRSVPSDITPSEAADADLSAGYRTGSIGGSWPRDRDRIIHEDEDALEEEPPMAATQWRVLSAFPHSENGSRGGSVTTGNTGREMGERPDWRLTLGQSVFLNHPQSTESSRNSHFDSIIAPHHDQASQVGSGSQNSRGSSNQTNVSHSRDIHSLRAEEIGGTGGSGGSNQSRPSRRAVSEHGTYDYSSDTAGGEGAALLSAFGSGQSRPWSSIGRGHDTTNAGSGGIVAPSPRRFSFWRRAEDRESSRPPSRQSPRAITPQTAPIATSAPGIRLVGASRAASMDQVPSSAPLAQNWSSQAIPLDVTPADGRRGSQSHSFVYRESPLHAYSPLRSASPGPSHAHSLSGETHDHQSLPSMSLDHSHTHGTHGQETTLATLATDDQEHEMPPDVPLSDTEEILRTRRLPAVGGGGEPKIVNEDTAREKLLQGRTSPPAAGAWSEAPRWQQL